MQVQISVIIKGPLKWYFHLLFYCINTYIIPCKAQNDHLCMCVLQDQSVTYVITANFIIIGNRSWFLDNGNGLFGSSATDGSTGFSFTKVPLIQLLAGLNSQCCHTAKTKYQCVTKLTFYKIVLTALAWVLAITMLSELAIC